MNKNADVSVKKLKELTVFFPAYNEEANITSTVLKTLDVLPSVADKWELLIINDGSKDGTAKVIDKLAKAHKNVRAIHHEMNRGYGAALKTGFYNAQYQWISFTDSDGQFDFGEITHFIQTQSETNADLVVGYYKKRQVSTFKILTSKMWEAAVFVLFGLKLHDIDCGFKLIRKEVIDTIPPLESERGAFISSEFLIKARQSKFKIVEIPVTHYPRTEGVGTGRNINVIIQSFVDLGKLWMKSHNL